jgi:hypothetical protein
MKAERLLGKRLSGRQVFTRSWKILVDIVQFRQNWFVFFRVICYVIIIRMIIEKRKRGCMEPFNVYMVDGNTANIIGVYKMVKDKEEVVSVPEYDEDRSYQILFEGNEDGPHVNMESFEDGSGFMLEYNFLHDVDDKDALMSFLEYARTRAFLDKATERFGQFGVFDDRRGAITTGALCAELIFYFYKDGAIIAYLSVRCEGVKTYKDVFDDYQFMRKAFEDSRQK